MYFEIIGSITDVETIAAGSAIRDVVRLRQRYGRGRWRKLKGIAMVRSEQRSNDFWIDEYKTAQD